jgi:hypothetical protein
MILRSPAPDVVFVTSFSPEIYQASGRYLIRSFIQHRVDGHLLCGHEGNRPPLRAAGAPLLFYDLDVDSALRSWRRKNRHIIPRDLGGDAGPCGCAHPDDPWAADHRPGCTGQWFNRNASRWFRKIVCLRHALTLSCDVIVWLDADCRFHRRLTRERLAALFRGRAVFYLKSRQRRVPDTGIFGLHLGRGGRRFAEHLIERYESGVFRKDTRWDDGAQFELTRRGLQTVRCVDLATHATGDSAVVPNSPLRAYLTHDKGRHYALGVMT